MTLRVLHVLNDLRGGATMSAMTLMREGLRRGSDIEHFVAYPGRWGDRNPLFEGVATDFSGVPIRTWQKQKWQSKTGYLRWLKAQLVSGFGVRGRSNLRQLVERWNIDVIHTNSAIVADGALVARQLGIPHVWHIREKIGSGGFMEFPMADRELARYIADSSVRVPVISTFVQDFFTRNGQEASTELVHDGIDIDSLTRGEVKVRGLALRQKWGVPENATLIGMVGGLKTRVKRHDLFIDMAAHLAAQDEKLRFIIVGSVPGPSECGSGTWGGRIVEQIQESGLSDRLVFTGFLEDMSAAWSAMDIYVHHCAVEGFSRAILEAMATGTPVVAVDAGGNPEAIVDKETGFLVQDEDGAGYAETVMNMVDDREMTRRIVQGAYRTICECFSIEKHYGTMQDLFNETIHFGFRPGGLN